MDPLPDALRERLVVVLGADEVERILTARSRPSIRVNTIKSSAGEVMLRLAALGIDTERVPFAPDALVFEDPEERSIGALWEHQAGYYFGQDAASHLPVLALDPQPGERILDLCAAPGGKTAHISARMDNRGMVVANDPNPGRLNNLISNVDRLGCLNIVETHSDGTDRKWPMQFDRVLVDAPCSNLGTLHETWRPAHDWTPGITRGNVTVQKRLLAAAFRAARVGATIVYSTCTLEPRENEGAGSWFLDEFPVDLVPFDARVGREGLTEAAGERYRDEVAHATRLHPGDAGTDGFFLARFVKREARDETLGQPRSPSMDVAPLDALEGLVKQYQLDAPELLAARGVASERKLFASTIPNVDGALLLAPHRIGLAVAAREPEGARLTFDGATLFGRGAGRTIELTRAQARAWVAGNDVELGRAEPFAVVTCEGEPIGGARTYGTRLPCFVPKERRVADDGVERYGFLAG